MDRQLHRTASHAVARWTSAAVIAVSLVGFLPAVSADAEPKPSRKELTAKEKQLADQLEKLTEQYNGLQVRLKQAQRASKIAADNARSQQQNLETVRVKVAQLAAERYKNGGLDPAVQLAASRDPQKMLDQSATLNYFTSKGSDQVRVLFQTLQATSRAQKAAQDRAERVNTLGKQAEQKLQTLRTELKKVKGKLGESTTGVVGGPAPNVAPGGASAKALGAVRAALARLGTPYSWGGGNAKGPSYGIAQGANIKGFDCSGLTLYAYAQVGVSLPHYTGDQFNSGVRVTKAQLRPGDLVFFYSDLHHMGMYIGNGKMVHAPQTGDVVKTSSIEGRPFAGGVRVG
ncbi:NlpC/P60 family protein [Actinomadura scrupuli]|uniref:C40 family peptidase n=1 Tax=Actinomadura scrupuli TaxID=559629 RepID=UPI003D98224C